MPASSRAHVNRLRRRTGFRFVGRTIDVEAISEDLCKTDVHKTPPVFLSLNLGKRTTCRRKAHTDCIHADIVKLLHDESVYFYINMKIYRRSTKQIKIAHDERSNMSSILTGAVNINEKAKHNPVNTPRICFRTETIGHQNTRVVSNMNRRHPPEARTRQSSQIAAEALSDVRARAVFCIAETVPCRLTNEL